MVILKLFSFIHSSFIPMETAPKSYWKLTTAIIGAILVVAAGLGFWWWRNTPALPQPAGTMILVYTQKIKETATDARFWPTVQILRKVGTAEPEILAEVGKVGEYPISMELSPDKKSLLINLESKLQILDLATKQLKDLFIPKQQVVSFTYSPDKTQLFIWDQAFPAQDENDNYYAHRLTLATGQDEILTQGQSESSFYGSLWREDDKIIMGEARGEISALYFFDLSNNRLIKTPGDYNLELFSESGKAMTSINEIIENICNDFSLSQPSGYEIIDPVSGNVLDTISAAKRGVSVLAFSPDDSQILYQTEKPHTKQEDCDKTLDELFFIKTIGVDQAAPISDPIGILTQWDQSPDRATWQYNDQTRIWSILLDGQPVVTSTARLELMGQYEE